MEQMQQVLHDAEKLTAILDLSEQAVRRMQSQLHALSISIKAQREQMRELSRSPRDVAWGLERVQLMARSTESTRALLPQLNALPGRILTLKAVKEKSCKMVRAGERARPKPKPDATQAAATPRLGPPSLDPAQAPPRQRPETLPATKPPPMPRHAAVVATVPAPRRRVLVEADQVRFYARKHGIDGSLESVNRHRAAVNLEPWGVGEIATLAEARDWARRSGVKDDALDVINGERALRGRPGFIVARAP